MSENYERAASRIVRARTGQVRLLHHQDRYATRLRYGRDRWARRPRLQRPSPRVRGRRLQLPADRLRSHARERSRARARERAGDEGLHRPSDELRHRLPHRERHQGVPQGDLRGAQRRAPEDGGEDRVRPQGELGQGPGHQGDRDRERGDPPAEGRDLSRTRRRRRTSRACSSAASSSRRCRPRPTRT